MSRIYFDLAQGVSLEEALREITQTKQNIHLPESIQLSLQGESSAFQDSLSQQWFLILAAIVTMYLILGILYESYIHPITILSTLPSAMLGALIALALTKQNLNMMGIIGIILLIGIVKKNAIMMVDFALEAERVQKISPEQAIEQAALLRLRPILMTTFAALLGAFPLLIGSGMGSELRYPLGLTMVGGLLLSQVLTLLTTPIIYLSFSHFFKTKQIDSSFI
jgi:multidrug efflux pump